MPLRTIFEAQTIAAIAKAIDDLSSIDAGLQTPVIPDIIPVARGGTRRPRPETLVWCLVSRHYTTLGEGGAGDGRIRGTHSFGEEDRDHHVAAHAGQSVGIELVRPDVFPDAEQCCEVAATRVVERLLQDLVEPLNVLGHCVVDLFDALLQVRLGPCVAQLLDVFAIRRFESFDVTRGNPWRTESTKARHRSAKCAFTGSSSHTACSVRMNVVYASCVFVITAACCACTAFQ